MPLRLGVEPVASPTIIVGNQYGSLSSLQIAGFAAVGMTELWVWLAFLMRSKLTVQRSGMIACQPKVKRHTALISNDGGRCRIRTYDFHRVRMALYR